MENKEFLYVGHYYDIDGVYILKVGTTNNLKRRQSEHNRAYRKPSTHHRMADDCRFTYDWHLPLSKYNTLRFEDKTKDNWKNLEFGTYLDNDRFVCPTKPEKVYITIRKTYEIVLE